MKTPSTSPHTTLVIFDFDGTIADTFHHSLMISNNLARQFNFKAIKDIDIEKLKNMPSQEVFRTLEIPLVKIPFILAQARKELHKHIDEVKPIEGLDDVLRGLKKNGHQLGIFTSNAVRNVKKFVEINKIDVFDFIKTSPKIWGKDHGLTELVRQYGSNPKNTYYVGDETRDITAAQQAGVHSIAVTWGYNAAAILKKHTPDHLIDTPQQLLDIFPTPH